MIVTHQIVT